MAIAPKRFCSHPACSEYAVDGGHGKCAQHKAKETVQQRTSSSSRGYNRPWNKASTGFRKRNPLCIVCCPVEENKPNTSNIGLRILWSGTEWHEEFEKLKQTEAYRTITELQSELHKATESMNCKENDHKDLIRTYNLVLEENAYLRGKIAKLEERNAQNITINVTDKQLPGMLKMIINTK